MNLNNTNLQGADLRGTKIGPRFNESDFSGARFSSTSKIHRRWFHYLLENRCTLPDGTKSKNCAQDLREFINKEPTS
jgi:uncharacterized protein YjbI with pentapeptide repeats